MGGNLNKRDTKGSYVTEVELTIAGTAVDPGEDKPVTKDDLKDLQDKLTELENKVNAIDVNKEPESGCNGSIVSTGIALAAALPALAVVYVVVAKARRKEDK